MILVDPREGSKQLYEYIIAVPGHPQCELSQMEYGDVVFVGNGPTGPMIVAFEVKSINDILNCIETQRFTGHQLPGLKAAYDVVYLLVQGDYRADWNTGELQIPLNKGKGEFWWTVKTGQRTWSHYEFTAWLTMVEVGWGIRSRRTMDEKDSARTVIEMYRVLSKEWEEHKTLKPFYLGPQVGPTPFAKPSLVERMVAQIEGIGPAKAREIGKRFKSMAEVLAVGFGNAEHGIPPDDLIRDVVKVHWKGIPGIGKPTAERIIKLLWQGESCNGIIKPTEKEI